jgi:RNA polymerase sigma-70 factor (ECF subfamily)
MPTTSTSLLQRLRERPDARDWRRLDDLYRPFLLGFLRRHGLGDADADDLAQEILAVVVRELPAFEHNQRTGAFRAWLRAVAAHRMRDFFRSRKNRPAGGSDVLQRLQQLEDPGSALSGEWDREHDRHVVGRLLDSIRHDFQPATWQAFRAVMLDGLTPAEAAERLNVSVNSVLLSGCPIAPPPASMEHGGGDGHGGSGGNGAM